MANLGKKTYIANSNNRLQEQRPSDKARKYFTPLLLIQLFQRDITGIQLSIANLAILGLFFAMRSYEYVKEAKGERKTQLIIPQNIECWGVQNKRIEFINPGTSQEKPVSLTF